MTVPKLSTASSGMDGRGYVHPVTKEVVPGVTTVLNAIDKPGIVNFHIEQTIAYAATHIDDLMSRTEEARMGFLRYKTRPSQKKITELLDEGTDEMLEYSGLVLNDLAELGNWIHGYIDADMQDDLFLPEPVNYIHVSLMEAYHEMRTRHVFKPVFTEVTIFGEGYAGTADYFGEIDGVMTMADWKTSKKVYDSHEAQVAALGAGTTLFREVTEDTPGAIYHELSPSVAKYYGGQIDSWWVEEGVPGFQQYAVVQIRPDDDPKPRFAEIHVLDQEVVEAGWDLFRAALAAKHAQKRRKDRMKVLEKS